MYIIAELTGVVTEMLLAHIYFNGFFTKRSRPWWAMGSAYIVSGIILALLSFVPNASFLRLAFYAIALLLIAYSFFSASIIQAIYASISYCCLYVRSDSCYLHYYLTYAAMALRIDRAGNYETQEDSDYLTISAHLDSRIYCWNYFRFVFLPAGSFRR